MKTILNISKLFLIGCLLIIGTTLSAMRSSDEVQYNDLAKSVIREIGQKNDVTEGLLNTTINQYFVKEYVLGPKNFPHIPTADIVAQNVKREIAALIFHSKLSVSQSFRKAMFKSLEHLPAKERDTIFSGMNFTDLNAAAATSNSLNQLIKGPQNTTITRAYKSKMIAADKSKEVAAEKEKLPEWGKVSFVNVAKNGILEINKKVYPQLWAMDVEKDKKELIDELELIRLVIKSGIQVSTVQVNSEDLETGVIKESKYPWQDYLKRFRENESEKFRQKLFKIDINHYIPSN
jgi:hypothetical protein